MIGLDTAYDDKREKFAEGQIKKLQFGGNPMALSTYVSPEAFNEGTKQVASGFNWLMGKAGDAFARLVATAAVPSGSATGSNVYANSPMYRYNLTHVQPGAKRAIETVAPYISPSNYIAAITQGSLNPRVGAEFLASDPRLQALGIAGDLLTFKFGPKAVKNTPTAVDKALAATGNKGAKGRVVAREIDKNIPEGRLEVTDDYFHAPDKWYRIANRPEKMGIEQDGKNITTRDADYTPGTPNRWRADMQDTGEVDIFDFLNGGRHLEPGKGVNEGYFVFMPGSRIHKTGSAHGNTSQASKGSVWKGSVAGNSELFPMGIIEGQAPSIVPYGRNRSSFVDTPWEEVPEGSRIGFHTGEMPMSNLGWFQRTNKGTYTYEPIIPEKRITFTLNKPQDGKTSLAFFERRPSKISEAERIGIPKGERFVRPFRVANYPGYQLKGLMKGSQLERQLSKNGTININQLNSYFNKASQLEREVVNKVLAEKFAGQKTINYNQLKKSVQDELIGKYDRVPQTEYADYGVERLGYNLKTVGENELPGLPNQIILEQPIRYIPPGTKADPINLSTFTFESPRIPYGNIKHYEGNPLGHSRTYILSDDPHTLYIMESQSDWAQNYGKIPKFKVSENGRTNIKFDDETMFWKPVEDGTGELYSEISNNPEAMNYINNYFVGNVSGVQPEHLAKNYLQRQLQENLRYAAENGQTKMRYPTSETAVKIEGYMKQNLYKNPEGKIVTGKEALQHSDPNVINNLREDLAELGLNLRQQGIRPATNQQWIKMNTQLKELETPKLKEGFLDMGLDYLPQHQTILKKYADFPKLFQKLFKDQQVRTVTDTKGNTWYEVDVTKGYLSREWQFKQGGQLIPNDIIKRFKYGRRIQKTT